MHTPAILLALVAVAVAPVRAQHLNDAQIAAIVDDLAESATHSWELGTRTQALLELDTPSFSALTRNAAIPPSHFAPSSLATVLQIATDVVSNRSTSTGITTPGPQPLIDGAGAAGDPASLGVSVLIANWTGESRKTGLDYAGAAKDQLDYLLTVVPRTPEGAISQRVDQVQLWSDFTYMVPPFLAYYGAITANKSLMIQGYTQLQLYREQLFTPSASLWEHIVLGTGGLDSGHWSTGNGWACSGIMRVIGTFSNSVFKHDGDIKSMIGDLSGWANEILNGMYAHQQASGLFLNYADQAPGSSPSVFEDSSSTALIAACAYRHSILNSVHIHVPQAERARKALSSTTSPPPPSSAKGATPFTNSAHFTKSGYVVPVVNPENWSEELDLTTTSPADEIGSPESEGFVIEMQSAWKDWVQAGSIGA